MFERRGHFRGGMHAKSIWREIRAYARGNSRGREAAAGTAPGTDTRDRRKKEKKKKKEKKNYAAPRGAGPKFASADRDYRSYILPG